jgi:DHA2 family multidrug resistance protein
MMRQLEAHLVLQSSLLYHALQSEHRVNLVAHLDGTKFEVQQRLQLLQKGFMSKGFTANAMKKHIKQLIIPS